MSHLCYSLIETVFARFCKVALTILMTGLLFSGQAKAACIWQPVDALDVASSLEFKKDTPADGEATIGCLTSGNTSADIIVPASVTDSDGNAYTVTQLGTNAFFQAGVGQGQSTPLVSGYQLRSITLPNTLRIIDSGSLSHNYLLDSFCR